MFWDSLKPQKVAPVATAASLTAQGLSLELGWSDGAHHTVAARVLRQHCPCAECVEEWSGRRTFAPEQIAADLKALELSQVGNYALSFTFSDLHRTGIFPWSLLRELAERGS